MNTEKYAAGVHCLLNFSKIALKCERPDHTNDPAARTHKLRVVLPRGLEPRTH